jgi:2-polyprenyl-3-methyl-5-hydroxy-6-metoxy-1,4-benzoquinol methylase
VFVQIPHRFMQDVASGDDRMRLYISGNRFLRYVFWLRLRAIFWAMRRHSPRDATCLDFGGGSGVFLPSLARHFRRVVCIDLDVSEARRVVDHYRLANVTLHAQDIRGARLREAPFAAIVAADVLEHFADLGPAVDALWNWLDGGGFLYTSLPTESTLYNALRKIFGIVKPADHYHTGYEVEAALRRRGFHRQRHICVPLVAPVLPLFLISVWTKEPGGRT